MYKVVIGLEVHCELDTNIKNFSKAKNSFSKEANTQVAPLDIGLPGTLPYPNEEAVKKALKTALALNCKIPDELLFDRKHYFYPDLPLGYQITQNTKPIGKNGYLEFYVGEEVKRVDIHQLHLEVDTASLEHFNNFSLIDYNRSGIPLMEIVTEPCIHSADEAVAFLEALRSVFLYCQVSEADSKKGQMRCDVNISLMKEDSKEFGTKIEMKNINAFNTVRASIEYEIKRQTKLLDAGEKVIQETRRFSEEDAKTYAMRKKEDALDYRYMIDPNIVPIKLTEEFVEEVRKTVPILEHDRIVKYINEYKLSQYDATIIAKTKEVSDYFEEVISLGAGILESANWMITIILGSLNKLEIELSELFISPKMLAETIKLVEAGDLSQDQAKKIVYRSLAEKIDPIEIIKKENLKQIYDTDIIRKVANEAIDENPNVLEQYFEGKDYVANFFIGKIMQKTNRQANPAVSLEIVKEELEIRRKEHEKK